MIRKLLCFIGFHKFHTIWFGYVAYKEYPYTYEICECGCKQRTYNDRFGEQRPSHWTPESFYMTTGNEYGKDGEIRLSHTTPW